MKKPYLAIGGTIAVLIIALLGLWSYKITVSDKTPAAERPQSVTVTSTATTSPTSPNTKFVWSFAEKPSAQDDPMAGPQTAVTLTAQNGKKYDLGTYSGSCTTIERSSWQLFDGEQSGAICWWAGAGTELGVFQENGSWIVKKGDLEEAAEEMPGLRGNFTTLLQLN